MKMNPRTVCAVSFVTAFLASPSTHAGLIFTIENPGVQSTTVASAVTETFDSVALGVIGSYPSVAIGGTYSGGQINAVSVFGGAGGVGQFDVVGLGTTTSQTLQFDSGKTYFGLWWSAGDPSNKLEFFDAANALLGSYVIGDIIPFLAPAYLGNPNGGGNAQEYYAYLNFTTTAGSLIDKVIFSNVTRSGFESDNHSVFDQPITPPGNPFPTPDAGATLALLGGALGVLLSFRRKTD